MDLPPHLRSHAFPRMQQAHFSRRQRAQVSRRSRSSSVMTTSMGPPFQTMIMLQNLGRGRESYLPRGKDGALVRLQGIRGVLGVRDRGTASTADKRTRAWARCQKSARRRILDPPTTPQRAPLAPPRCEARPTSSARPRGPGCRSPPEPGRCRGLPPNPRSNLTGGDGRASPAGGHIKTACRRPSASGSRR